mmetsp:Transcript_5190/g.12281  ORF Transcript_5190/g.12281 Transcript_5190/m.12281 type:complete len:371 (+) Transcript_5190:67-1179(+)
MRVLSSVFFAVASVSTEPKEVQDALRIAEQVAFKATHAVESQAHQEAPVAHAATPAAQAQATLMETPQAQKLHAHLSKIAAQMRSLSKNGGGSGAFASFGKIADKAEAVLAEAAKAKTPEDEQAILKAGMQAVQTFGTQSIADQTVRTQAEDEAQEGSLLMGVLTTNKDKWPMDKQVDTVKEFVERGSFPAYLLLKGRKDGVPLNAQLADIMDDRAAHPPTPEAKAKEAETIAAFKAEQKLARSVSIVEKTVSALSAEGNLTAAEVQVKDGAAAALATLKAAVKECEGTEDPVAKEAAAKKGATALKDFMVSFAKMSGKFSQKQSLLQVFKTLQQLRDCPYCVEQCIEKCHSGGGKFSGCLTKCADAGKR